MSPDGDNIDSTPLIQVSGVAEGVETGAIYSPLGTMCAPTTPFPSPQTTRLNAHASGGEREEEQIFSSKSSIHLERFFIIWAAKIGQTN